MSNHLPVSDERLTQIAKEQAERWAGALALLADNWRDGNCPSCAKQATIKAAEAQTNTQTHRSN